MIKGIDYAETETALIFHIASIDDWFICEVGKLRGDGNSQKLWMSEDYSVSSTISSSIMRGLSNTLYVEQAHESSYTKSVSAGFETSSSTSIGVSAKANVFGIEVGGSAEKTWQQSFHVESGITDSESDTITSGSSTERYSETTKGMSKNITKTISTGWETTVDTEVGKYYVAAITGYADIYEYVNMSWDDSSKSFVYMSVGYVVAIDKGYQSQKPSIFVSDRSFTNTAHLEEYFSFDNKVTTCLSNEQIDDAVKMFNQEHKTAPSDQNNTAHDPENSPQYADYTKIYDEAGLKTINGSGKYVLMNDIALNGSWIPISTFSGTLDGNGYTISNLSYIGAKSATSDGPVRYGLFESIRDNATICNLTISNANIALDFVNNCEVRVGVIAGNMYGNSTISNCKVTESTLKYWYDGENNSRPMFGAIAGLMENDSSIIDCVSTSNTIEVASFCAYAGGIAGVAYHSSSISDCTVYDDTIKAMGRGQSVFGPYGCGYAGGIVAAKHSGVDVVGNIVPDWAQGVNSHRYDGYYFGTSWATSTNETINGVDIS